MIEEWRVTWLRHASRSTVCGDPADLLTLIDWVEPFVEILVPFRFVHLERLRPEFPALAQLDLVLFSRRMTTAVVADPLANSNLVFRSMDAAEGEENGGEDLEVSVRAAQMG